jgi:hypothetical protein
VHYGFCLCVCSLCVVRKAGFSPSPIQSSTAVSTILSTFGLLSNGILEGTVTIHSRSLKLELLQVSNLSVLGLFNDLKIGFVDIYINDLTEEQQQKLVEMQESSY